MGLPEVETDEKANAEARCECGDGDHHRADCVGGGGLCRKAARLVLMGGTDCETDNLSCDDLRNDDLRGGCGGGLRRIQ